ncbi:MAG: EboA domain-containing protein [Cytophagales bacterium]|nr:EboA domain-containing protein [Cytophagales bacterium]
MNDLNTVITGECIQLIPDEPAKQWFSSQISNLSAGSSFFLAFGMAPKKVGKQPIILSNALIGALSRINPDANQVNWSLDELVRLALLLQLPMEGRNESITKLIATSDIREQKLIFKSLQYLQQADDFELQVIDGIRTNMTDVYDAIALHSSYPKKYFKEGAWNQMVLKGIFMERPIYRIYGLDERRNADLARIAIDFAHERQSAGRKVTPELWRLVVPFVDDAVMEDLIKVAQSSDELEQDAGKRALTESKHQAAHTWLKQAKQSSELRSWNDIGSAIFEA